MIATFEYTDYADLALRTAPGVVRDGEEGGSRTSRTRDTSISPEQKELLLGAVGLTGEAGEVAELVKKHVFHGHELDRAKLLKELGDVLWYLTYITVRCLGMTLLDVMRANIHKLSARYPEGFFTPARSITRAAGDE